MAKKQNIETIIKGCCKGDPSSQRILMNTFADQLYAICIRYLHDKEFAKDALQESFVKIFKGIHTYDASKAQAYTWMSTITVRTCLRKLERSKLDIVHIEEVHSELPFKSDALDRLEVQDLINLVDLLPVGYRDVFNMYVIDGFSHKEIAEILDITDVSSRSRLKRSKEMLKKYIINIEIERSCKNII